MGLTKQAHGLPRFMMDCGWWRNGRRWRRPTLAEIGLHHAAVSFANEHGTDGTVPGPADDLAVALSLPVRDVKRTVPLLIERGVWVEHADGDYEIVGFLDHNPSRHEVDRDRQQRAEKAGRANHQRWHVKEGVTDPDCSYCKPRDESRKDSPEESRKDSSDESCADSNNGRNGWKEGTEVTSSSVFVSEEPRGDATVEGDDDDRLSPIWAVWAERDRQRLIDETGRHPRDDEAWLASVAGKRRTLHCDEAVKLIGLHLDWSTGELVDELDKRYPKAKAHPLDAQAAAARTLAGKDRSCSRCGGSGWFEVDGTATICDHRATA